ncbi:MAG: aspartate/glutamate racemase family protein [Conexivisphaerales archaeon]
MAIRVLYAVPGVGLEGKELERRKKILNSLASGDVKVEVKAVDEGPESIESPYDEYLCVPPTIKLVRSFEKDFDAAIIGCFGDPGIEALRDAVKIPVAGPGESSMLFASTLGHKFSVITINRGVFSIIEGIAERLGVAKRMASIRGTGLTVTETNEKPEMAKTKLLEASREAVERDGADTIVLGCMSEAFLGFDKVISEKLGVPVVNPVVASLRMAESYVRSNLVHSPLAYGRSK